MTKRDYLLIAGVVREAKTEHQSHYLLDAGFRMAVQWIEGRLAYRLFRYDPRFDKAMFREACSDKRPKDVMPVTEVLSPDAVDRARELYSQDVTRLLPPEPSQ